MYILAFCHALYEFKLVSQFLNITASVVLSCRETNAHPTPTVLFGQSLIKTRAAGRSTDPSNQLVSLLTLTDFSVVSEMVELMKEVSGFEECDQENVHEWLEFDEDDPGYELLTDDDIIAQVQVPEDDDDEDEISDDIVSAEKCPSNEEAFKCFETAIKWLEHQDECDSVQLLSLKRLRDLAAKKRVSKLKQTNMFDFFFRLVLYYVLSHLSHLTKKCLDICIYVPYVQSLL